MEKIRLVEETLQPGMSIAFVARTHVLPPSLLFKWRQRMVAGGRAAVRVDDEVIGATTGAPARGADPRARAAVGRKTLEVAT